MKEAPESGRQRTASDAISDRSPDRNRERRLEAIRREAALTGKLEDQGVRPLGSPMPRASVATGYYGIPLLKEPQWSWEIPVYFFVGGAAGAAAVIGQFAHWTGADPELVSDARSVSVLGAMLSPALLISDLGIPSRFFNMLRVFKVQSPMSVGAYIVSGFGTTSVASKLAELVRRRYPGLMIRTIENAAGLASAITGLGMATYTGVLIGATSIAVWNENIDSLPIHFALSGLGSAVSSLELMGHEDSRALNLLGIASALGETLAGVKLESSHSAANEPLKRGVSGAITRAGSVLSGPLPLALRIAAALAGEARSRRLRRAAAVANLAGSFLTRLGWIRAGHASARDYRLPLKDAPPQSKLPSRGVAGR